MGLKLELDYSDELKVRAEARVKQKQRAKEPDYRAHPWPWIRDAVVTIDQARQRIAKLPCEPVEITHDCGCGAPCGNYLEHMVRRWFTETPLFAVPKSRRMMATWTMLALHTWLCIYRPGTRVAVISRKLGDNPSQGSWELIERVWFILQHLPPEVLAVPAEHYKARITWPSIHSEIIGIAQGPDQLRQLTVTAILGDECAHWEEARETYVAMLPTLEGGGRVTLISSANPSFFQQICFDSVNVVGM